MIHVEKIFIKALACIALSMFTFQGCALIEGSFDAWVGKSKSDLVASLGNPSATRPDGSGGEILIYEEKVNIGEIPTQAQSDGGRNILPAGTKQGSYTRRTIFYVNQQGYVYKWETQG